MTDPEPTDPFTEKLAEMFQAAYRLADTPAAERAVHEQLDATIKRLTEVYHHRWSVILHRLDPRIVETEP